MAVCGRLFGCCIVLLAPLISPLSRRHLMYWTSDTPQSKTEAGIEGVQGLGVSGAMKMLFHNLNGNLRYFPSRASKLHRKGSVCRKGRRWGHRSTAILSALLGYQQGLVEKSCRNLKGHASCPHIVTQDLYSSRELVSVFR